MRAPREKFHKIDIHMVYYPMENKIMSEEQESRRLPKKDLIQIPVPLRRALQCAIEARGGGRGVKTRIIIEALRLHPDVMRFYE